MAELEVAFPNIVFAPALARDAATVPLVVTALEGVELNTVPSPVKVTDVTVPPEPVATNVVPENDKPDPKVMAETLAKDPVGLPSKLTLATC